MITNEQIIAKLQAMCQEPCEIEITSRKPVKDDCDFVKFSFDGTDCIAVVWDDGGVFTPDDWQAAWGVFDPFGNPEDDLATVKWVDCDQHPATTLDGFPRTFLTH